MKSLIEAAFVVALAACALGATAWVLMTLWATWAQLAWLTIR